MMYTFSFTIVSPLNTKVQFTAFPASNASRIALYWLFRKRSFAVSGDFHEILYATIETKHQLIQTDLFGYEVELKVVWIFIGIFPANKLGITRNEWRKTITDREVLNKILN